MKPLAIELSDILAIVIVALSQALGHWTPWHLVPALVDADGKLHRPLAYAHGCVWIWIGLLIYALAHPAIWPAVWFLGLLILGAAAGTMLPRAVSQIGENRHLRADRQDLEEIIDGSTDAR